MMSYQGYIGCYVNDPSMFDFLTMAPHADPTQMNPILCSVACTTMGYYVSRIQLRTLCFCKKTTSLTSNQVSDSYCFSPDSLCSTDPAYYCGTTNYSLVYASQGNVTSSYHLSSQHNIISFLGYDTSNTLYNSASCVALQLVQLHIPVI